MSENDESKTVVKSMEETKNRHKKYLYAVNNPVRRHILRVLKNGPASFEEIKSLTDINRAELSWHLDILEYGFCIEKTEDKKKTSYSLTREGRVVDYIEK